MMQVILMWIGGVLASGVLLVMALGPVIVEVDSWWYERRHNRRRPGRDGVRGSEDRDEHDDDDGGDHEGDDGPRVRPATVMAADPAASGEQPSSATMASDPRHDYSSLTLVGQE
jgi:hypothetical protein